MLRYTTRHYLSFGASNIGNVSHGLIFTPVANDYLSLITHSIIIIYSIKIRPPPTLPLDVTSLPGPFFRFRPLLAAACTSYNDNDWKFGVVADTVWETVKNVSNRPCCVVIRAFASFFAPLRIRSSLQ
ncbi:unnamed protein product [Adineta ricciae]|uniref:Uncharacterized protein n=1 Tax=Adineta ricciae TaxID=249248 RepID=A0A814BW72_ADIRI|nr:unnamed protein product [Adineta ricciae]